MQLYSKTLLATAAIAALCIGVAKAADFNIPAGDLKAALDAYARQSGVPVLFSTDLVRGYRSKGVRGDYAPEEALTQILSGTGLSTYRDTDGSVGISHQGSENRAGENINLTLAQAAPTKAAVETVTVTSSKLGGADVQSIPIAITALSQEQLTATQTAGGPDLIKQVPNMTFTKTNFSGYSIQLRGIGTQAISVTTDPAVAVAFNDTPFIRNHFFEQEFYDTAQVEVLRGPQGTLYGRNATAGVVNLISAKPTDQFEAMASADIGNYHNRRFEGMINIPIVDDRFDLRIAGEWTKRQGYSFNDATSDRIDGRDLWSGRVTLGLKPIEKLQVDFVWEHFSENDDRLRSSKQLCKTDHGPGEVDGVPKPVGPAPYGGQYPGDYLGQGCLPTSLYSPDAFQAPLGYTLPYILGLIAEGNGNDMNPYASETQSRNLRVINSGLNPEYKAKNDTIELNADYDLTPSLKFISQTGYNDDFLWSAEDYNRYGAAPGLFPYHGDGVHPDSRGTLPDPNGLGISTGGSGSVCVAGTVSCIPDGILCDPQVGCSDKLIVEDLSTERAWQLNQEFRLASNFSGPLNFSVGANYLHYETTEKYYVFSNVFTDIDGAFHPGLFDSNTNNPLPYGFQFNDPSAPVNVADGYVDPNPLASLNDNGHNYFLSKNPYVLNSYAAFGEANYNLTDELKLTAGLRWTGDRKHFLDVPSWLIDSGWGYPVAKVVDQSWGELTGRAVANWTPKLDFTDQTLIYGSYSHGYKAGGANPPGALFSSFFSPVGSGQASTPTAGSSVEPVHPLTFKPEFIDAFEVGTKNTLLDGALTLNGDVFYYNYENYQISQIVDRTAINLNFDAHAKGAELEATYEPLPGLRFNFSGGWEEATVAKGQSAIDLMDRTAGHAGWYVVKPFVNEASNCILPDYVVRYITESVSGAVGATGVSDCAMAYILNRDPFTQLAYVPNPTTTLTGGPPVNDNGPLVGYPGFDPSTAPNDGQGFAKNIGGDKLPNAPPFTVSFGAQYTVPLTTDWAGTLRGDFYWQSSSWWRVFNDLAYDRLRGYDTVNLTLILTSQNGWQVMLYDKNVFNTTAITGAFLNSDDSGLTTNIFLTDPKLIGIRVTKNW